MRRLGVLAALALAGSTAAAIPPPPMAVLVGGRVVEEPSGGMRFGWPGVYFEGRFSGAGVLVTADPGGETLAILIDGERHALMSGTGGQSKSIDGLTPGPHAVRLERLTESQSGSSRFLGFWANEPDLGLPPRPRKRRIEFIGDSHTVGYGNTSPRRECTRQQVHDTTDTQQAFGPLLAKKLDWDYRVIAYSGFGIVRNYDGGAQGDSLPKRYARAIPGEEALADDSGWQPDWVVIDLGSNDFSTKLHAGEAWVDEAALHSDYRRTYAGFVRMLLAKYPAARFLLVRYALFDADVRAVAAEVADPRVATIAVEPHELTGCDWHPSLKDDRAMAAALERAVSR